MGASRETRDLLGAALARAQERHALGGLTLESLTDAATRHAQARLTALGLEASPEALSAALGRMCLEDLCLTHACEEGSDEAWAAFQGIYAPRLLGLALKQGLDRERADAEVSTLLSELALPSPRGAAATVLGTYRASGSLFGWLAVILMRRIARDARRARPVSLERVGNDGLEVAAPRASDPAAPLIDAESSEALRASLEAGWQACTPREQLVLALKHRDGLRHREIAERLGVGVPRVSQLWQQGLARLAAAAKRALPEGLDSQVYEAARKAAEDALATFEAPRPPTRDDRAPGEQA